MNCSITECTFIHSFLSSIYKKVSYFECCHLVHFCHTTVLSLQNIRSADKYIVNVRKVYIERNNVQLELM